MRSVRAIAGRVALAIASPLLVLALLEVGLAIAGVPQNRLPLLNVRHGHEIYWTTNPDYGAVLFGSRNGPALPPLWIPVEKPFDEYRIVVLGESAAEGFPISHMNLARVLETILRVQVDQPVRVISLAMTGINSHHIRELGLAAAKQLEPDAVVLYAGNNEAIGPYGPASAGSAISRSFIMIRMIEKARSLRVAHAVRRWQARKSASVPSRPWEGLHEFQESRLAINDPRLIPMYRHAEANVRDLVARLTRKGVNVVVCTMGVNLSDWPPMRSDERTPSSASHPLHEFSAIRAYERANQFRESGLHDDAWLWYRRAADLDIVRFRADSRILDLTRGLSTATVPPGQLIMVDVDRALHEEHSVPFSDDRHFYEHVHLTVSGRIQVAAMIAGAVLHSGWMPTKPGPVLLDPETIKSRLGVTPMDHVRALSAVRDFYRWPLFAGQWMAEERIQRLQEEERQHRERVKAFTVEQLREIRRLAQSDQARDPWRNAAIGSHFLQMGYPQDALPLLEAALADNPALIFAYPDAARAAMRMGHRAKALEFILAGRKRNPHDPVLLTAHAEWAVLAGRTSEADLLFNEALNIRPNDLTVLIGLARLAETRKDFASAAHYYRRGLAADPDAGPFLNNLALILLAQADGLDGAWPEAKALARRAVEVNSRSPHAWWTLARAQHRLGDPTEALNSLQQAMSLTDPTQQADLMKSLQRQQIAWGNQP